MSIVEITDPELMKRFNDAPNRGGKESQLVKELEKIKEQPNKLFRIDFNPGHISRTIKKLGEKGQWKMRQIENNGEKHTYIMYIGKQEAPTEQVTPEPTTQPEPITKPKKSRKAE
ncbi:MAG: hypothetical protein H3Z52_07405 [archaeon]|nr:hypothetical protein [archaeon]